MKDEYNFTQYTDEVQCPYCGHEFTDSWEIGFDDNQVDHTMEITCESCEIKFKVTRHIRLTYSSVRDPKDCNHPEQTFYCDYCDKKLEGV